jgi:hypothetical protein
MKNETVDPVAEKLDIVIQLLAVALTEGKKQRDQIRLLALAGLNPSKIAEMLTTTPNTVNVCLSSLRKDGLLPKGKK